MWSGAMGTALAQDQAAALAAIEELRKEMKELRQDVSAKNKKIEELERKLDAVQKTTSAAAAPKEPVKAETGKVETAKGAEASPQAALDEAVKVAEAKEKSAVKEPLWSKKIGKAEVKLLDISADLMVAGGSSTATDHQLQHLQGGGHDPKSGGSRCSKWSWA